MYSLIISVVIFVQTCFQSHLHHARARVRPIVRGFSRCVHIEMSILDPQELLINHIRQMLRCRRLIMGLPAEDDDSRASSHDTMPGLVTPMSSSSNVSMPDEMFPVREIEHGRYSV